MDDFLIEDVNSIRSFFVIDSSKYVLYMTLVDNNHLSNHAMLVLFNVQEKKSTKLDIRTTISESKLDYGLNRLMVVDVPLITLKQTTSKVERVSWIAFNTGDSLSVLCFTDLLTSDAKVHKWNLDNPRDCITDFDSKGDNNGNIRILYTTKLGNAHYIKFNTIFKKWSSIKSLNSIANDSLTCVSLGYSGLSAKWENRIGNIECAIISGFDNQLRYLRQHKSNDFKIESEVVYSTFKDNNILTSIDYQIVKKRTSTSSIIICCGNITNLGCAIYKRTTSGNWVFLRFLNRIIHKDESISTVNCQIVPGSSESEVLIYSGSENGELYYWKFDWKQNAVTAEEVLKVAKDGNVIHHILCIRDSVYYLVNSERIGIYNAIHIPLKIH